MGWVLAGVAIFAIAWALTTPESRAIERARVDRWAKPLFYVTFAFAIFVFVIYPIIWGDGKPFG